MIQISMIDSEITEKIEERCYKVETRCENSTNDEEFKFKYIIRCRDSKTACDTSILFPYLLDHFDKFTSKVKPISLEEYLEMEKKYGNDENRI